MVGEKCRRYRAHTGVCRALLGVTLLIGIAAHPARAAGLDIVWKRSKSSTRAAIVAFSPDSQTLAVGAENVDLLRVKDGSLLRTLDHRLSVRLGEGVGSLAFSPDGQCLATGDVKGAARCWKISDGTLVRTLTDPAEDVTFSPDSQFIVTSGKDGIVRLLRLKDWRSVRSLQVGPKAYLTSSVVSPDGRVLVSTSKETRLWQTGNGRLIRSIKEERFWSAVFSPDGQTLATAARDAIWLWRAADGTLLYKLTAQRWPVSCLAFSPDGHTLATGSMANEPGKGHGEICFWSTDNGQLLRTYSAGAGVSSIAFSKDNLFLAYGLFADATAVVARNPLAAGG
jgi:WD40 repeat protein